MKPNVICCGMLVADLKFRTEAFPENDQKVFADSFQILPGGPATNAAITIQQLGGQAHLLATIGKCALSDSVLDMIDKTGVNTKKVLHQGEALNVSAVFSESNGQRRVVSYKNAVSYETPKHLIGPEVILLDGHQPQVSLELIERFPNTPTILDAGSVHEGTELLFYKVDWLITSTKYALTKTGKNKIQDALKTLAILNSKTIITTGEQGCIYSINGEEGSISPMKEVRCLDSNGAGDVFHGAFAHALALNKTPMECMDFANKIAAKSCESYGIIGAF